MKLLRYSGPVVLLAIGFAGLFFLSTLKKEPPQKATSSESPLVVAEPVLACQSGFKISVDGEVIPYREISLSTQVSGRIAKKNPKARAGNFVRKGDLLFEVDPRDYQIEVKRLNETVKQAGSSIEELDVEQGNVEELVSLAERALELQQKEVKRFEDLRKENATSTSQLEKVRQNEIASLNSLQALKNQLTMTNARRNRLQQEKERALTSLEQAELNLSRATVTSPIDGVVIQDFAEQDDFVQVGTRLVRMEDTSKVEVRFNLRMDQLQWIWKTAAAESSAASEGSNATYTYELPRLPLDVSVNLDGNRCTWKAHLSRYDGAGITTGTRTVPVIAVVDDPSKVILEGDGVSTPPTLLRGSFVSVDIPVGNDMDLVSIPSTAYQPDRTVWLYEGGKLIIHPLKVAYSDEDSVVVKADSHLKPGAMAITSPLSVANDQMEIRLVEDGMKDETKTARESNTTEAR